MTGLLTLWRRLFPLSEQQAIKIATVACSKPAALNALAFRVTTERPQAIYIPQVITDPCWYVYVPWGGGLFMLRGSRVIAISRITGEILFDGSANDEG